MADHLGSHSPNWELEVDTILVRRNLQVTMKGSHEPRPLVTPIYTSSTYVLESAEEGKTLSSNLSKVCA